MGQDLTKYSLLDCCLANIFLFPRVREHLGSKRSETDQDENHDREDKGNEDAH